MASPGAWHRLQAGALLRLQGACVLASRTATPCPSWGLCFRDGGPWPSFPAQVGRGPPQSTWLGLGGLGAGELFSVAIGDELEAN